jgi:hypothetical protein
MALVDIKADQLGIGLTLKNFWLRVPKHQREYAWEEDHVVQLFRDFEDAINREPPAPYFLGTLVTVSDQNDQLLVLDGQQRLATTSLLYVAMREYLLELGSLPRAQAIERHLWDVDADLQEPVLKLTLNVDDAGLFRHLVTGQDPAVPASTASRRKLVRALTLAREHVADIVAGLDRARQSDELNRWIRFLQSRAEVVLLTVPDRSAAFRIFRTLNDRGLSASEADLIKSHLFENAGTHEPEVERDWSSMRVAIESTSDDKDAIVDFLRYALIVQVGHIRGTDLFDKIETIVGSQSSAAGQAALFRDLAEIYVATTNASHDRWQTYPTTMRRSLAEHRILDIKPLRPLLIAVSAKMRPSEAAETMAFLVSLGVRLNIASTTRSSTVEVPLGNAAQAVYAGTLTTAEHLRGYLDDITPGDRVFEEAFAMAKVTNAKLARYYLRCLEEVTTGVRDPYFAPVDDAQQVDLEHVLPKRPDADWDLEKDEVSQLVARLGNLALIKKSDNGKLRSAPFADKRPVYAETPYVLTKEIARLSAWGPEDIVDRQDRMASLAPRAWPIRPASKPKRTPTKRASKTQPEDVAEIAFRTMREATGT